MTTFDKIILCGAFPIVFSAVLSGQVEPNWGTTATSARTIHAVEFERYTGGTAAINVNAERYCTVSGCVHAAGIDLPSGALITEIGIDACDTTTGGEVVYTAYRRQSNGTLTQLLIPERTGVAATPGCMSFSKLLAVPHQVDNQNSSYFAYVYADASAGEARFGAFRVFYKLQVSPPPFITTFVDVPTSHPFYQFIEALAASGITAGCSADPPQYCPDATLTRGQMAVFLARALGLHFPN